MPPVPDGGRPLLLDHPGPALLLRPPFRTLARIATRIREDRTQILTCALGIAGAALVAQTRTPALMLAGFSCWVVGNLALMGIEWRAGHPWLAAMFGVYEVTALVGIANTAGAVL